MYAGTPALLVSEAEGADVAAGVDALSLKSPAEPGMPFADYSNGDDGPADQPVKPLLDDAVPESNGIAELEQTGTSFLPVSTQEISAAGVSEAEETAPGVGAAETGDAAVVEPAGSPAGAPSVVQLEEPAAVQPDKHVADPEVLEPAPEEAPLAAAGTATDTAGPAAAVIESSDASAVNSISALAGNYVKTEEYQPDSPLLANDSNPIDNVRTPEPSSDVAADTAEGPEVISGTTKVEEVMAAPMSVSAMAKQMASSSGSSSNSTAVFKPSPRPLAPKEKTPIDPSSVVRAGDKLVEVMEPSMSVAEVAKQLASSAHAGNTGSGGLQRENSSSKSLSVALSEHDAKNTANVAILLQSAEFKLQPGKDFVEYQELIKLRLEDGIDVTRKVRTGRCRGPVLDH